MSVHELLTQVESPVQQVCVDAYVGLDDGAGDASAPLSSTSSLSAGLASPPRSLARPVTLAPAVAASTATTTASSSSSSPHRASDARTHVHVHANEVSTASSSSSSAAAAAGGVSRRVRHVVFFFHGLHGAASDWDRFRELFAEFAGDDMRIEWMAHGVHSTESHTHDGIDFLGELAYREIEEVLREAQPCQFSFVGHSLGGLIARYAIGLMVKRQLLPSRHIVPVAFVSFAAPHAGVRNLPGAPSILSRVTRVVMQGVLGKTGTQLSLSDNAGESLLLHMSCPGSPFVVGLQLFASRVLYTMVESDNQVEFETSALSFTNPWHTKLGRELLRTPTEHFVPTSPGIVRSEVVRAVYGQVPWAVQASADQWQAPLVCSDAPLDAPRAPSLLPLDESDGAVAGADVGSLLQRVAPIPRDAADRIRRDVLLNLQRIQWQHVNVLFPARFSSMTAHKHIICKHDPNSVVGTSVARHFAVAMRHAAAAACARQRGGGVGGAVAPTSSTQ